MSLPYLKSLKKPELAELADQTELGGKKMQGRGVAGNCLHPPIAQNKTRFSAFTPFVLTVDIGYIMSLPYLKSLKKPELAELADQTELPQ
jgi:hypothetical protein